MLKVNDLQVYYGVINAIKGVSFEVNEGEVIALIGANGAGKTTILHTITGLVAPKSGSVVFEGKNLVKTPAHKIVGLGMAHVPEGRRVFAHLTVYDNLMLGAFSLTSRAKIEENLKYVYSHFPRLEERKNQVAGTLSGGEQQMLAMGRALMSNPKIILMDEPSMGLSPLFVGEIFKIILFMVTPVLLSTFAYNASALINQTLYLNLMQSVHNASYDDITIINGIYDTEAVGLSNIPIAIASAMASAILPSIAGSFETKKKKDVRHKISVAIKTIMFIAIPSAVGMTVLSRPIVWLLYNTNTDSIRLGGRLLAVLGASIVFYSLSTLSNSILQAVGKASKPVTNAVIALAVQTVVAAAS